METKATLFIQKQEEFYEGKQKTSLAARSESQLIFLLNFNNFIKSVLIQKYAYKSGRNFSVFDICSGKGGDIGKWTRHNPDHYVALDYSERLVTEAKERYQGINPNFPAVFFVADASDEVRNIDVMLSDERLHDIKEPIVFDIVSCQMAMHYVFENEARVRSFLRNVCSRLEPGGYFIGTIPDAQSLVRHLRESEGLSFGNKFYSVHFVQREFPKEHPVGNKVYFHLQDAIGEKFGDRVVYVPEYLVVFEHFVELAKEFDLELVESKNFHEFYEDECKEERNLNFFKKKVLTPEVVAQEETIPDQWEISGLYMTFAFRKKPQEGRQWRKRGQHFKNFKLNRPILNLMKWE